MTSHKQMSSATRKPVLALFLVLGLSFGVSGQKPNPARSQKRSLALGDIVQTAKRWQWFPVWDNGRLVGYEDNFSPGPVLYTVDRTGRHEDTQFTIAGAASITIHQVSAAANGEIAVVGAAVTSDQRGATFLARVAPRDRRQTLTRAWPYCPSAVTFAADGTIWTVGHLQKEDGSADVAHHVLCRFDQAGKKLSSLTVKISEGGGTDNVSHLRASRDRVGWLTTAGEYIEFSLDGNEVARYPGPDGIDRSRDSTKWRNRSMAISEDGLVVVAISNNEDKPALFYALNREEGRWLEMSAPQKLGSVRLFGFDGPELVTTGPQLGDFRRLRVE